jgi:membrane-associated phospholipid phosphatase
MSILKINELALNLVAKDFSDRHTPNNAGPTKTSRALAIIHLAAHDAYAKVTGQLTPRLTTLPNPPVGIGNDEATGTAALIGAGIFAAEQLYPDFVQFISTETAQLIIGVNSEALNYGKEVADAWIDFRNNDGSSSPDLDRNYRQEPGHHRPDPLNPAQQALGRTWGQVKPFVLTDVVNEALLNPPPPLNSNEYALAFDQVVEFGKNDITERDSDFRRKAVIGIFWGYDGSNLLGTPPRLYNQVVLAIPEFKALSSNSDGRKNQIKILTAINVAMADAGIAAWHWKYAYDFWRPVIGVREPEAGWGPSPGKDSSGNDLPALGDGNILRGRKGDPFWLPLGAPNSNAIYKPEDDGKPKNNGTPNFPAYPSGHATFGSACFEVAAALLGKTPEEITVNFVSDEFNGVTTDNLGTVRPRYSATFTLREAIEENKISRIYLGVHWIFDATGGETVGKAIAEKVFAAFR